ncbi:MAG: helix-turn-helix domain-containing protein [Nitriliruptorales bacterium]|nr:helix-turn-helix domain-containing protein [Nitriliruptorales bacterium]
MSNDDERAALAQAVERVGDRWSLLLVHALLDGPARFGELEERLNGISPNVLSQRLKQLEGDGLVLATPYQDRPVRHEYELTESGRDLEGALRLLAQWGQGEEAPAIIHEACGTPADARWWCPTCEREVSDETTRLAHL